MNIINAILKKYPAIDRVAYWETKYDGSPHDSPIDGLIWENTKYPKPTYEDLVEFDKLPDNERSAPKAKPTVEELLERIKALESKTTA